MIGGYEHPLSIVPLRNRIYALPRHTRMTMRSGWFAQHDTVDLEDVFSVLDEYAASAVLLTLRSLVGDAAQREDND